MGITFGDYLIDSGYYDITPEQERERDCPLCNGDCSAIPGGPPYNCPTYHRSAGAMSTDEIEALKQECNVLRKALYELLYVSFPPVGVDAPELVAKHHSSVRDGCLLLGIDPHGLHAVTVELKIASAPLQPVGHRWRWKGVADNNPWRYGHGPYTGSLITADVESLYTTAPLSR